MTASSFGNLPKLTVLMVVRNSVGTVGLALDSLKSQHYPKLELIIWDGVSTDGTLEVFPRYADMITQLVSEPDEGPPDAYNKALAFATGDFIGYLNADDEMEPGMLWAVAEAILANPQADVISAGLIHRLITPQGRRIVKGYYAAPEQLQLSLENALSDLPSFMLSRFISRELKAKVGPFNTVKGFCYIANDREWMARLAFVPCRNAIIPRALYGFNLHAKGLSSNPQNLETIIEEHINIAGLLLQRPDLGESQRSVVLRWQSKQFAHGFLAALFHLHFDKARSFFKRGFAQGGWRFIPAIAILLVTRFTRKLGLLLSNGIDRG